MAAAPLNAEERGATLQIISRLEQTPLLSRADIQGAQQAFEAERRRRVFVEGQTWGEASDDLEIYRMEQDAFFSHLRATDNDLLDQIARFNDQLDRWFKVGEGHAPYWPWRIAIILSKRGERELELQFLSAYCRHFHDRARRGSRRDEMIVERAIKKGAWDYWD